MATSEYKKTTIVFPVTGDHILLGMKKRGFGQGWWNGFGGKLLDGESYEECVQRECYEEAGIKVTNLNHVANLSFFFDNVLKVVSRAYIAESYVGVPRETDEMSLQIFHRDSIPYEQMWPADKVWVPQVLESGNRLHGFEIYFQGGDVENVLEVPPECIETRL